MREVLIDNFSNIHSIRKTQRKRSKLYALTTESERKQKRECETEGEKHTSFRLFVLLFYWMRQRPLNRPWIALALRSLSLYSLIFCLYPKQSPHKHTHAHMRNENIMFVSIQRNTYFVIKHQSHKRHATLSCCVNGCTLGIHFLF
jgi:hypothetical protein